MACRRSYPAKDATLTADDFTLINGIGPAIAARLYDTGILTFAQLADLTPDDITQMDVGRSAKRIASENWNEQARKFVPKAASHQVQASETASEFRQHYATFTVELLLEEDNRVRRTRVAYVQNNVDETWVGWDQARLTEFFVQSARLNISIPELSSNKEAVSSQQSALPFEPEVPPVKMLETPHKDIHPQPERIDSFGGKFRISSLETTSLDSDMPQYSAHANETFTVRIFLDLTRLKLTSSLPLCCKVTIWARKFGNKELQIIGELQNTLMPVEKIPCAVEAIIPSPGIYRLEAVVTISPESVSETSQPSIKAWIESNPLQII